ncbi:MAG: hypothetical protein M5U31_15040 [Acidimicrobiia bacterium]|nr:hypothetical protein [Acidimicrobiia bacterium]
MTTTTTETLDFPSVQWFRALADAVAADSQRYRHLGTTDCTVALQVGNAGFRLTFEAFGCSDVADWDGREPVDCVVSADADDWRELIEHIQAHGRADIDHTLNSLVLAGDRFRLTGDEQLGIDNFYRYNATLQAFIEEAAGVPTRFT